MVVFLGRSHLPGEKRHRSPERATTLRFVCLCQHTSDCSAGCINLDPRLSLRIKVCNHWCRREACFQRAKRVLCVCGPFEWPRLLSRLHTDEEICDGSSLLRVLVHKASVEVCEPQKDLNVAEGLGSRPLLNGSDPARIHRDACGSYAVAQKVNFMGTELTFWQLHIEFILNQPL